MTASRMYVRPFGLECGFLCMELLRFLEQRSTLAQISPEESKLRERDVREGFLCVELSEEIGTNCCQQSKLFG